MSALKKMLYEDNGDGTTTMTFVNDDGTMRTMLLPMPLQAIVGAAAPMFDLDHPAAQDLRRQAVTIPEAPDG